MQIRSVASDKAALQRMPVTGRSGSFGGLASVRMVDGQLFLLNEWLEGIDRTAREVWQTQGEVITPEFVRDILVPEAITLIDVRKSTVESNVTRAASKFSEDPYSARHRLAIQIGQLKARVSEKYEIEVRTLEHEQAHKPRPRVPEPIRPVTTSGSLSLNSASKPSEVPHEGRDDWGRSPVAFISYSWDSEEHKKWVLALASRIQGKDGVKIILDRWDLRPGEDRTMFMERGVTDSDFVILICTPDYCQKANSRKGGVGYEATVITGELAENINPGKFIPLLRHGEWDSSSLPIWIKTKLGVDLRGNPYSDEQYQELLRALHKVPLKPPPIGPKPVFETSAPDHQEIDPPEWAVRAMRLDEDLTPYDRDATRRKLAVFRIDALHPRLTVWLTNRSDRSILVKSVSLWHSSDGRNHKRLSHGVPSDNRVFVELRPRTEDVPIAFVTDEDAQLKLQSLGVVEKHLAGYEFSDDLDVEVRVEYDLLGVDDEYRETVRVRVQVNRQIKSL